MRDNRQASGSKPIRPGDADYLWLKRLEAKVKPPPLPQTFTAIAEWRLYELNRGLETNDLALLELECRRLSRMIDDLKQPRR